MKQSSETISGSTSRNMSEGGYGNAGEHPERPRSGEESGVQPVLSAQSQSTRQSGSSLERSSPVSLPPKAENSRPQGGISHECKADGFTPETCLYPETIVGAPLNAAQAAGEMAGGYAAAMRPPRKAGAQRGPIPCLYNNNTDKRNALPEFGEAAQADLMKSNHVKSSYALSLNVKAFCERVGIERVGFLTITFPDNVKENKEAYRRWNNAKRRVFPSLFGEMITVKERQKRGAWHYHCLVECREDIRTGFNFEALKQANHAYSLLRKSRRCGVPSLSKELEELGKAATMTYSSSASFELKRCWKKLRQTLPKYGFGRCELLPIMSTSEAIGTYVGKYIRKHIENRIEEDKGVRLVQYTKGARVCSTRFSWVNGRAYIWRQGMHKLSIGFQIVGYRLKTADDFKTAFGPRWAWRLGPAIIGVGEEQFTVGEGINLVSEMASQYSDFHPSDLEQLRSK